MIDDDDLALRNSGKLLNKERALLTQPEQRVLRIFREYRVTAGQMLCFNGQNLKKYQPALQKLTSKDLVVKEDFKGGYSLTRDGFEAMCDCHKESAKNN